MRWTASAHPEACGRCRAAIPPGDPIAAFTSKLRAETAPPATALYRCAACAQALGYVVDEDEVDLERWRLAQERTQVRVRREAAAARQPQYTPRVDPRPPRPPRPADDINAALAAAHIHDPRVAQMRDGE